MPSSTDFATWCRRLRASDREAFAALFRSTHDALFRYACGLTRDAAAARDVLQDVFVALWEMRQRLDPARPLEALLYRMTRNRALNYRRDTTSRAATRATLEAHEIAGPARPDAPDAALEAATLDAQLQAWVDALPERQREALTLSRQHGLTHDEIARVMDISPRTVNNHLVRALRTLRDRLHAYEPSLLRS
jgi:RNA polymerase sigma-70 factor (ECF subfamily)